MILPAEIWHLVTQHLTVNDRLKLMNTNKSMQSILLSCPEWRQFTVPKEQPLDPLIQLIPKIKVPILHFQSSNKSLNDFHLQVLKCVIKSIRHVDLRNQKISEGGLIDFLESHCSNNCGLCDGTDTNSKHQKQIETLILANSPSVTNNSLKTIGIQCPNLRVIDLSQVRHYSFDDEGICLLVKNPNWINSINLVGCDKLTDGSLLSIARNCPALQKFSCAGAFLVSDKGIEALLDSCKLIDLDVSYCWRVTDSCFHRDYESPSFNTLENLEIGFCYQLSNMSIIALIEYPKLCKVNISHCKSMDGSLLLQKGIQVIQIDFEE
ncbi:Transcription factor COE1 [Boothiomyces macroporosus]|uniref:Transcription factor COE1 n=1 Tax=Boothiomyces macroporosus TaxID=261099 RepID=A0AAD5ULG7_9FUNG|nr:Transcription factor COE1 [Boothiomyces macroporosus]